MGHSAARLIPLGLWHRAGSSRSQPQLPLSLAAEPLQARIPGFGGVFSAGSV